MSSSYQEAVSCEESSKYKVVIKEEMDSLRKNKTWELINHPSMQKLFDIKYLGSKEIIGMEIVKDQSRKILRVSQSGYILQKILNNFRRDNEKSVQMPLGGHFKLSLKDCPIKECDVERMTKMSYANARHSVCNYAKDLDKGRSITGYTFLVQGCVVTWKATLQHVVALSTIEIEYMALTEAVKEAIWLRKLLEELGVELNTVVVNYDHQGAIHLSRNHVFHERTKHINFGILLYIREVEEKYGYSFEVEDMYKMHAMP
ncbi:hypothetical protein Tco_1437226 [Tanacetum coccineum]